MLFSAACSGEIGEPTSSVREPDPFEPAPGQMRRLTATQYANLIHDTFGASIVVASTLEPDIAIDGLSALGASSSAISARGVEQYEQSAYEIADQVLAAGEPRDALMPCEPEGVADARCAELFVRRVGRRVWRRPVPSEDVGQLVNVAGRAAMAYGDFYEGVEVALAAMLQSPYFLFRIEVGELNPDGRFRRFTGWEMAERLAFFFWDSGPDDRLMDAAARGDLHDFDKLRQHVHRLLDDSRTRRGLERFFSELLELELLDGLRKDPQVFEHYSPELMASAKQETLHLVHWLVLEEDADYRELLRTRTTFLDRRLAAAYGVAAPSREGFGQYVYPEDSPRRGVLGHMSLLASHANESSTSATRRGAFLRERLLCTTIPTPPPDVNTSIPEPTAEASTLRARVARHLDDPVCAGCHHLMDPLGLALGELRCTGPISRVRRRGAH